MVDWLIDIGLIWRDASVFWGMSGHDDDYVQICDSTNIVAFNVT